MRILRVCARAPNYALDIALVILCLDQPKLDHCVLHRECGTLRSERCEAKLSVAFRVTTQWRIESEMPFVRALWEPLRRKTLLEHDGWSTGTSATCKVAHICLHHD